VIVRPEPGALTEATERLLKLLDEFSLLPIEKLSPVSPGISFHGLTKSGALERLLEVMFRG